MFYNMRQLWVYNFGIHNCTNGSAIMCVWNECIAAGRGSSEIICCFLKYFAQTRPKAKEIVIQTAALAKKHTNDLLVE